MTLKKLSRTEQWKIAGKILKEVRKARKITQVQLSETTGLLQSTISSIESGKRGIPDENLDRVAKALWVPEAALIAPNVIEESEYKNFIPRRLEELLTA